MNVEARKQAKYIGDYKKSLLGAEAFGVRRALFEAASSVTLSNRQAPKLQGPAF